MKIQVVNLVTTIVNGVNVGHPCDAMLNHPEMAREIHAGLVAWIMLRQQEHDLEVTALKKEIESLKQEKNDEL
jgi:hypothetical protein